MRNKFGERLRKAWAELVYIVWASQGLRAWTGVHAFFLSLPGGSVAQVRIPTNGA